MKIHAPDFNLEATLESGQVFGFRKDFDNIFHGFLQKQPVRISQNQTQLCVQAENVSEATVKNYFDLDRDLSQLYQVFASDEKLTPFCLRLKGLRLIRQDSWEALACFIISSNNNVKRIQGIWKNMAEYFAGFPTAAQIAKSHERTLRSLGLGYRAPFLLRTATFLSNAPDYLETIRNLDYEEARARVISFPGIGPKVADCVLLYGFHKIEAFPVDVWIARVMRKLYFKNRKVSEKRVQAFGQKRWGAHAGYVQQYLFHGARMGIL